MSLNRSYDVIARAYADGVRLVFAPAGKAIGDRGDAGATNPAQLAESAERLKPDSAELTQVLSAQLVNNDPTMRLEASTRLLAKALTDLRVSSRLLEAAEDEAAGLAWSSDPGSDRSVAGLGSIEEQLRILEGTAPKIASLTDRGVKPPKTIDEARNKLETVVDDNLALIADRASTIAQQTLGGLLGLGMAQLLDAAGLVGGKLAEQLGVAEQVGRLYLLFRDYALQAYDALEELIGKTLLQEIAKKVVDFVDKLKESKEEFEKLLERLYETKKTGETLKQMVAGSPAALSKYVTTLESIDRLNLEHQQQTDFAGKLLWWAGLLNRTPVTVIPQARLLMAGFYIVLGAYTIFSGGDFVDAPQLQRLDRIPGVARIVQANLASA